MKAIVLEPFELSIVCLLRGVERAIPGSYSANISRLTSASCAGSGSQSMIIGNKPL